MDPTSPAPTADMAQEFGLYATALTEIGIVNQLSTALFERRLPEGVLVSHFSVLNHLVRLGDGRTPLAIARAFQVPKTTMTHTLAGLEARGWIRFVPNPADGRSKLVQITEAGRAFRLEAVAAVAPDLAQMAKAVPPDRIAGILSVLGDLRAYLDAERDGTPPR